MSRIWTHISNGEYSIACTGQTVHLYGKDNAELARFKGLRYAYDAVISPKGDLFVVKSSEGHLIWFGFNPPRLIKKVKCSQGEKHNFCFSPDGERLYNLESLAIHPLLATLSIYRTSDFSLERRMSWCMSNIDLQVIEYDSATDAYYLLGYVRNLNGCASKHFIARLDDGVLRDIAYISDRDHWDYDLYKSAESCGFTENAIQWLAPRDIWQTMRAEGFSLAKAWAQHRAKP